MTVEEFAQTVLAQQKARLAEHYSQWQADAERVHVIPGPKYTKVDLGTEGGGFSGKYMVENATGVIYGIKGYGKVHKGHIYGTLDTVDEWHWGEYSPSHIEKPQCGKVCPCTPPAGTWYAGTCTLDAGHDGQHSTSGCCYFD